MITAVTTSFSFEGHRIREYKGLARGIIVRAPTIAQGILGGLKSIIGGQIGAFTEMCEQTRSQAYEMMLRDAERMGANAVIGMRYDAAEVSSQHSATEVICYGTAVVIEPVSS
ncbi:MAG: YbjQ family protein [Armatimonadota bacterium]